MWVLRFYPSAASPCGSPQAIVLQFYIPPEYRCFNFCPNFCKRSKTLFVSNRLLIFFTNQIYHRLDGDVADLFALEDDITRRIAIALGIELIDREAARSVRQPDAFDYILRGTAVMNAPKTRQTFAEAIALFDRALTLDPRAVEAQSRLAIHLAGRVARNQTDTAAADMARAEVLAGKLWPQRPAARWRILPKPLCCACRIDLKRPFAHMTRRYRSTVIASVHTPILLM